MLPIELANELAEPWAYALKLLEYCEELNNTRLKISKQEKNVLTKSFAVLCLDNSKGIPPLWTAYHLELIPFLNSYTNFGRVLVFWNLPML